MRVEDEGIERGGDVWGSEVIGLGKKAWERGKLDYSS